MSSTPRRRSRRRPNRLELYAHADMETRSRDRRRGRRDRRLLCLRSPTNPGWPPSPAAAATPNPAMMAMPVPVTKIIKKTLPIYLEYSARIELIGNVALQAKVSGISERAARARRRRRQAGRSALQDRSARFPGLARSGESAGGARRRFARVHALQFRSRRRNSPRPASSPRTPSINAAATCGRPKRRSRWIRPRSARRSSTSAIPKSARLSPGASGETRRRSERSSAPAARP